MSSLNLREKIPANIKHDTASMLSQISIPAQYRDVFVQTMEQDVVTLNSALARSDLRAVLGMLHRMHGAFAVVGISKFAGRCEVLQQRGRDYGLDDTTERRVAILSRDLLKLLRLQQTA